MLLEDVNHAGIQEEEVNNWEPAHSLVEDVVSVEIAAALAFHRMLLACLSASGKGGSYTQPACSPLVFTGAQSFVLLACQASPQGIRVFLVSLAISWFGLLCHISSLRLSLGHSSLVLTLRKDDAAWASLSSPHSMVVDVSI